MVLAEAMVRGLPLVSTTGGAAAETVPDAAAIKVPPDDAGALADALRRAICDGELRARLAAGALAASEDLPTWDSAARTIAQALRNAHGKTRGSVSRRNGSRCASPSTIARSRAILRAQVAARLEQTARVNIMDMGCGSGSNLRALADSLGGSQRWTLVDWDDQTAGPCARGARCMGREFQR